MKSTRVWPVGRVLGLWRYPVKSMGPEQLSAADVSWQGVRGDRRWAFVRDGSTSSAFPWLTIRDRAQMSKYQPSFVDPERPETSQTLVRTPSGDVIDVTDPSLLQGLDAVGARLIRQGRGAFDTFPLSVLTTQTLAQLGEAVGEPLAVQRFRPNILIEAVGDQSFPEDAWVGRTLWIGKESDDARSQATGVRVDQRDARCMVVTVDPETGERNPQILRAIAQQREGCLGVYGTTVRPGRVAVGDAVWLDVSTPSDGSTG